MQKINYTFYATLLDSYQWYLDSEDDNAHQDLIDRINRVPFPATDSQRKGTLFNDLIDGKVVSDVDVAKYKLNTPEIFAKIREIKLMLGNASRQVYLEKIVDDVKLYGFADAINFDTIYDIKTTGNYEFGKFKDKWQHLVYFECTPLEVSKFEYIITDFKSIMKEFYVRNSEEDSCKLRGHINHFKEFLVENKHLITDKRIFGECN